MAAVGKPILRTKRRQLSADFGRFRLALREPAHRGRLVMPALIYEPEAERIRFIIRWRYTVFPMVFSEPMFYLLLAIHAFMLWEEAKAVDRGEYAWPTLDWKAALVPTSLLTFFVVFYGGNCYTRFYALHSHCVAISGCVSEWAYLIHEHFSDAPSSAKWNMMRLMLGGMQVHYAFLGGEGQRGLLGEEVKAVTKNEWRAIRRHNFLSRAEIEKIDEYRGARYFLPIAWALGEVKVAMKSKLKASKPPALTKPNDPPEPSESAVLLANPGAANVHHRFEEVALRFRQNCSQTLAMLRMPVPFAYFHVLKVLIFVSLFIVGYALLELEQGHYMLSFAIYLVICTILIGMQAIAVAMSDPFGDDDTDFDIELFMSEAYDNAIALLCDERETQYSRLPAGMENPLGASDAAIENRSWKGLTKGFGLSDERETPRDEAALLTKNEPQSELVSLDVVPEDDLPGNEGSSEAPPPPPPSAPPPKAGVYSSGAFDYYGSSPAIQSTQHTPPHSRAASKGKLTSGGLRRIGASSARPASPSKPNGTRLFVPPPTAAHPPVLS